MSKRHGRALWPGATAAIMFLAVYRTTGLDLEMAGKKSVAVALIHGIGNQTKPKGAPLTFSKALHKKLVRKLGHDAMVEDIAWREIYWADVFQERENKFLLDISKHGGVLLSPKFRKFVVYGLADAGGYATSAHRKGSDPNSSYRTTQTRVEKALSELEQESREGAPLVIVAHSMGAQIISDYLYDLHNKGFGQKRQGMAAGRSLAAFVTFGCNIPIFMLGLEDTEDRKPPPFPGHVWRENEPWWFNYWDVSDPLGFPLTELSPDFAAFRQSGLYEKTVNAGGLLRSWSPLSHNAYWTEKTVVGKVAEILTSLRENPPLPPSTAPASRPNAPVPPGEPGSVGV